MNKYWLYILPLWFVGPTSWANTLVSLDLAGHHGPVTHNEIEVTPNALVLNGIAISSHVVPAIHQELSVLLHPVAAPLAACTSGKFTHTVQSAGGRQSASGCLESEHAKNLVEGLHRVERLSYLRSL